MTTTPSTVIHQGQHSLLGHPLLTCDWQSTTSRTTTRQSYTDVNHQLPRGIPAILHKLLRHGPSPAGTMRRRLMHTSQQAWMTTSTGTTRQHSAPPRPTLLGRSTTKEDKQPRDDNTRSEADNNNEGDSHRDDNSGPRLGTRTRGTARWLRQNDPEWDSARRARRRWPAEVEQGRLYLSLADKA